MASSVDNGRNRHGYPQGYHFVPRPLELIRLLADKIAGRRLPPPLLDIFQDVRILDYHPDDLYETYKAHVEAGCIYFFSHREFPMPRGDRGRPVRVTRDGGNWKASGGGKPVSTMKRGGAIVGYELTMVFYDKRKPTNDDNSNGMTEWGLHEYTIVTGHKSKKKQVADLALYRLYKKKKKQHVVDLHNGWPKLEQLPSPPPPAGEGTCTASTSQAQAQASVGQPHGCYHQDMFTANPPMQAHAGSLNVLTGSPPGPLMTLMMAPSLQAPTVNYPPTTLQSLQQALEDSDLVDWDNMMLTLPGPAAVAHDLPLPTPAQQQDAEHPGPADSNEQPLKMVQPPPQQTPTAAAGGGYLDEEFKVWCEMQQGQEQPAASSCWFPLPDDNNLPMLTDDENQLSCTIEELLAGMLDDGEMSIEEPDDTSGQGQGDTSGQGQGSKSNQ